MQSTVTPPDAGDLRIILQQLGKDRRALRSWPGGPPNGTTVGKVLALHATQSGDDVPIHINYDKMSWSGLSWAVGEIRNSSLDPGKPITIHGSSAEKDAVELEGKVFVVKY